MNNQKINEILISKLSFSRLSLLVGALKIGFNLSLSKSKKLLSLIESKKWVGNIIKSYFFISVFIVMISTLSNLDRLNLDYLDPSYSSHSSLDNLSSSFILMPLLYLIVFFLIHFAAISLIELMKINKLISQTKKNNSALNIKYFFSRYNLQNNVILLNAIYQDFDFDFSIENVESCDLEDIFFKIHDVFCEFKFKNTPYNERIKIIKIAVLFEILE